MFSISGAKRLLALTAVLIPSDVFVLGQNAGWGATFPFAWYANSPLQNWFLTLPDAYSAFSSEQGGINIYLFLVGDSIPTLTLQLWVLASVLSLGATTYLLVTWGREAPVEWSDQAVGVAFIAAAVAFLVSRFLIYDTLLVGQQSDVHHYSLPIGALYMGLVGGIFYFDLF